MSGADAQARELCLVVEWVAQHPHEFEPSDIERILEASPRDSDRRTIRRMVFDALPAETPVRERVKVARWVGLAGAFAAAVARAGTDAGTHNRWRRERGMRMDQWRTGVLVGLDALLAGGRGMNREAPHRPPFTRALAELAKCHGIQSADDSIEIGERLMGLLDDLPRQFAEPVPVPPPLAANPAHPASVFDRAIAVRLKGALPLRAQARLIVRLREGLLLPATTEGAIYQRIRNCR